MAQSRSCWSTLVYLGSALLGASHDSGLLALIQNWLHQYGARVDADIFVCAASGKSLNSIQPANPKFSIIPKIILDLQTIIGTPSMHLVSRQQKLVIFASFAPTSARYSCRRRPGLDSRPGTEPVHDISIRGGALLPRSPLTHQAGSS